VRFHAGAAAWLDWQPLQHQLYLRGHSIHTSQRLVVHGFGKMKRRSGWDQTAAGQPPAKKSDTLDELGLFQSGPASSDLSSVLASQNSAAPTIDVAAAGQMVTKLLMSMPEAALVRDALPDIQVKTGTMTTLSNGGDLYPGTTLQQLIVRGQSLEALVAAATHIYGRIAEQAGMVTCGEAGVEIGGSRLKVLTPSKAVVAIIGKGGGTIKQLRLATKCHVHIDENIVPPGVPSDTSEQTVCISGPLGGAILAFSTVVEILLQFSTETWFRAWGAKNNSGIVIPGLVLFEHSKGFKGKGKGDASVPGSTALVGLGSLTGEGGRGGLGIPGIGASVLSGLMVLKLLVPSNEASCILGKGGATVNGFEQASGTKMAISGRHEFYPGTELQQVRIRGPSSEAVMAAAILVLAKIAEVTGTVNGGEHNVEPGGARIKLAVPSKLSPEITGEGGSNLEKIKTDSGMQVHLEDAIVPPGPPDDLSEQVMCLSGPLLGAQSALTSIVGVLGNHATEAWFRAWCEHSHCGTLCLGLSLFQGKGKGLPALAASPQTSTAIVEAAPQNALDAALIQSAIVQDMGLGVTPNQSTDAMEQLQALSAFETLTSPPANTMEQLQQALTDSNNLTNQLADQLGLLQQVLPGLGAAAPSLGAAVPSIGASAQGLSAALSGIAAPVGASPGLGGALSGIGAVADASPGLGAALSGIGAAGGASSGLGAALYSLGAATGGIDAAATTILDPGEQLDSSMEQLQRLLAGIGAAASQPSDPMQQLQQLLAGIGAATGQPLGQTDPLQALSLALGVDLGLGIGASTGVASALGGAVGGGNTVASQPVLPSMGGAGAGFMAAKILLAPDEVAVLGVDTVLKELQASTGSTFKVSEEIYPGTQLHEVNIQGISGDGVLSAAMGMLQKILEAKGTVSSGDRNVEMGGARLKVIVPAKAAAGVIGKGGQNISIIETQTGCRIMVDMKFVPCGETGKEQAVLLCGQLTAVCMALSSVFAEVAKLNTERWFQRWANRSNAGTVIPGLVLLEGKGKGKGLSLFGAGL